MPDPAIPGATFFLGHLRMPWTVTAIAMGVGLPAPVSRNDSHISPAPPRPRFALLPRPGGGGSHGDTRGKAVPRNAAIQNKQVAFQQSPFLALFARFVQGSGPFSSRTGAGIFDRDEDFVHVLIETTEAREKPGALDRGGIAIGGGADGECERERA